MKSPSMTAELRQHPYRALFPLGWLMAWWGVLPWILFWLDPSFYYPRETHALILVQGVLTPFAVGFMFTMLPRRLDSAPPDAWQLLLSLVFPPLLVVLVWQQHLGLSHAVFAAQSLMLFLFSASRIFGAAGKRTGPAAFMWVPIAFVFGCVGAALLSIAQFSPTLLPSAVIQFAWLALTQGLFVSLVLGIGTMFVPLTSHK
ncbi:MAG: hypothetical protein ACI84O_000866 [Myxococcota bacterium]|jgi:hypothetical protein